MFWFKKTKYTLSEKELFLLIQGLNSRLIVLENKIHQYQNEEKEQNKEIEEINDSLDFLMRKSNHNFNLIRNLEKKDKHNNRMIKFCYIKLKKLSKLHHYSRLIINVVRNIVSPLSPEEKKEKLNLIKNKL